MDIWPGAHLAAYVEQLETGRRPGRPPLTSERPLWPPVAQHIGLTCSFIIALSRLSPGRSHFCLAPFLGPPKSSPEVREASEQSAQTPATQLGLSLS